MKYSIFKLRINGKKVKTRPSIQFKLYGGLLFTYLPSSMGHPLCSVNPASSILPSFPL